MFLQEKPLTPSKWQTGKIALDIADQIMRAQEWISNIVFFRPTMRWTYDPAALYTILCIDEGTFFLDDIYDDIQNWSNFNSESGAHWE